MRRCHLENKHVRIDQDLDSWVAFYFRWIKRVSEKGTGLLNWFQTIGLRCRVKESRNQFRLGSKKIVASAASCAGTGNLATFCQKVAKLRHRFKSWHVRVTAERSRVCVTQRNAIH